MLEKIASLSGIQAVAYTVVQLLILVTTPFGTQLPLDQKDIKLPVIKNLKSSLTTTTTTIFICTLALCWQFDIFLTKNGISSTFLEVM